MILDPKSGQSGPSDAAGPSGAAGAGPAGADAPGTAGPSGAAGMPATKTARQARIAALLGSRPVRSQAELAALLAEDGLVVGQATLSRDLVEMRAVRVRGTAGGLVYAVPSEGGDRSPTPAMPQELLDVRLARLCGELLVTAEASANIVVLRTPPGAANFLALAIDHSVMPSLLGTIAGDDTVMLITRDPQGGAELAERFLQLAADPGASSDKL